jgi:DNA-binding NtrC family response regulator
MSRFRILIVDDEVPILDLCRLALEEIPGAVVSAETDGAAAAKRLEQERFDLAITDMILPGVSGIDLVRLARARDPELAILVVTGHPSIGTAVEALRAGAADYLVKPLELEALKRTAHHLLAGERLARENFLLARQVARRSAGDLIPGASPAAAELARTIDRVAAADVDVLVTGETGAGKELVARSIHRASRRRAGRFVPVDCGAIPASLLESELFGFERGSFTGARDPSIGLFEFADRGTIFLDEIGDLPVSLQPKLLRVLQERRLRRIGGRREIGIDVRVIAATHRDLERRIEQSLFRADLYYRINVARVVVPALRDRREDVPALVEHFIARTARELGKDPLPVEPDALDMLVQHDWRGNVRELANMVRSMLALADGRLLTVDDLPESVMRPSALRAAGRPASGAACAAGGFFAQRAAQVEAFEREFLTALLGDHGGDVIAAARTARLPRGTLYRLLGKHEIAPDRFRR